MPKRKTGKKPVKLKAEFLDGKPIKLKGLWAHWMFEMIGKGRGDLAAALRNAAGSIEAAAYYAAQESPVGVDNSLSVLENHIGEIRRLNGPLKP